MTKATDIQAIDRLLSTPASQVTASQVTEQLGADQLGTWQAQQQDTDSGSTGAWDAFDVWRRLIKEPRDRRRPQPE